MKKTFLPFVLLATAIIGGCGKTEEATPAATDGTGSNAPAGKGGAAMGPGGMQATDAPSNLGTK